MNSITEIRRYLAEINKFLDALEGDKELVQTALLQVTIDNYLEEFTDLRHLLHSEEWVEAVPGHLLCSKESDLDKQDRAIGIIDTLISNRIQKPIRILDFGCGEGHVVKELARRSPELVLGYDIKEPERAEDYLDILYFTFDLKDVINNKPYDLILAYDVFDHIVNDEPVNIISLLQSVLSEDGVLITRCHPWCGRHGGHLYHSLNKAFVHLYFTEDELDRMDLSPEPVRQIVTPREVYASWFADSHLEIVTERITKDPVEKFFISGILENRLKKLWTSTELAVSNMEISFIDYICRRKR